MITDYQAGASLTDLAAKYGYNRVGISGVIKGAGVQIRRQGLMPAQVAEAQRLYGEGQSLATLAARFNVDAGTEYLDRCAPLNIAIKRHRISSLSAT